MFYSPIVECHVLSVNGPEVDLQLVFAVNTSESSKIKELDTL